MKRRIVMLFVLLFIFEGRALSKAHEGQFTLKNAIEYACEHNSDIQRSKEKIEQLDHSFKNAISTAFPTVDLNSAYKYYTSAATSTSSGTRDPLESYDFSLNLTQPVYSGGKIVATISRAHLNRESAKLDLELSTQNVTFEVMKSYFSTVLLNEKLYTLQRSAELERKLLKLVENKFKVGIATQYDVLKIKVLLNNIEPQILDMEAQIKDAQFKLNSLLGRDAKALFVVVDKLDIYPLRADSFEAGFKMAELHRVELQKIQKQEEILKQDKKIEMAPYWPTLTGTAKYGYTHKDFSHIVDDTSNEWSVGGTLKIPLFAGLGSFSKASEFTSKQVILNMDKASLHDDIISELKTALVDLEKTKNKLQVAGQAVKDAQEAFRLAQRLYKAGRLTTLDLVTSERDSLDSQFYFLQTKYDYYLASVNIRKVEGLDVFVK